MKDLKDRINAMTPEQLETVASGLIELLESIEKPAKPQPGDRCMFWDDCSPDEYYVGILLENSHSTLKPVSVLGCFDNCRLLIKDAE